MPLAQLNILAGRPPEKIELLIARVTQAIAESLDADPATVRVLVNEVPSSHWGIGGASARSLGR